MGSVLFLLYTSEIWLFLAVKKEKNIKNSKQNKNLEKDREKIRLHKNPKWCHRSWCGGTGAESFPFSRFMQVYFSSNQQPSHPCFMISCSMSNETGRWIISPEYLLGTCLKELIHLEVVWKRSVSTHLSFLFRRPNGGRVRGTDDSLLVSSFNSLPECELLLLRHNAQPFLGQGGQFAT